MSIFQLQNSKKEKLFYPLQHQSKKSFKLDSKNQSINRLVAGTKFEKQTKTSWIYGKNKTNSEIWNNLQKSFIIQHTCNNDNILDEFVNFR